MLAGGAARRMNGVDKGLIEVAGKPLAQWVAEALEPQVSALLISANRNVGEYNKLGWPVVGDRIPGYQGPLAGIAAALGRTPAQWLLVSPCDTPLIPLDLARRLAEVLCKEGTDIAIAADRIRQHPLHALIPRTARDDLDDYLAGGSRSVAGWLERHRTAVALFDEAPSRFANCNDRDDVAAIRSSLGGRSGKNSNP